MLPGRAYTGKLLQSRKHIEYRRVAIRVHTCRQCLGFLPAFAARKIRHELEQHVGHRRQRYAIGEHLAQTTAADRKIGGCIKRGDHSVDQS